MTEPEPVPPYTPDWDEAARRDDLIAEFAASFRAEVERQRRNRTDGRAALQKELEKVARSIDRALAFILDGDGDPGSVRAKLAELEARKRDLERQLGQRLLENLVRVAQRVRLLQRVQVLALQVLDELEQLGALVAHL